MRSFSPFPLCVLCVLCGESSVSSAADRAKWTTSRMAGSPEPPVPYATEPAFLKLTFQQPVLLEPAPGTGRLFVGELGGRIVSFPNDPKAERADLALDLAKGRREFGSLYGMAFHPRFAENREVFVCYVLQANRPDGTRPDGSRVSRFRVTRDDPPRIDQASEEVVLTWMSGGHNGGCLAFGPDGFLYVSTGDGAGPSPPDPLDTGQDVSDLLSSILRIDVDRRDAGRAYRVPPDNPLLKAPGARPEIWAYGFRNPWRMSFDRDSGALWVGDVGWELWEMIDRVERGGNYGWSVVEGRQPVHPQGRRGPTPILPPTVEHPHSEAASITGGYVYRGSRLPELRGMYLYGDFQTGIVWGLRHDGKAIVEHRVLAETPLELVSFGQDESGEVFLVDHERSRQIHRLVPNPAARRANRAFPRRLSETGLFASTRDHRPAPGVVPYAINAPMWSDYAEAERLLAIPGDGRMDRDDRGNLLPPDGSVLARTVLMGMNRGDSRSRRRIETQVLHREAGSWRPYTYVWDDDQGDATLAEPGGAAKVLTVADPEAPGGKRVHDYRIHARSECLLCHNPWVEKQTTVFGRQSASPLALSLAQLNREVGSGEDQLRGFEGAGLLAKPLPDGPAKLPRLADPYDDRADRDARARAYLQVNCSHCHQYNAGGAATIQLGAGVPLAEMKAVGVAPSQGTFGIAGAQILAPGDPEGSVLYYRVAKLGGGRMPRVGSSRVDERAVRLLHDWIIDLPGRKSPHDPSGLSGEEAAVAAAVRSGGEAAIRERLGSTRGAVALMWLVDRGRLDAPTRRRVVALAKDHPGAEVRDLFERFVPDDERVRRLGDMVNPSEILKRTGDVDRGRGLFFAEGATSCQGCHRVGGRGSSLGPDLSRVAAKYDRRALLEQILEPSKVIEPQYRTYLVSTRAGQLQTGLLVEKTPEAIVLRDAQDRTIRVPAADVEQLAPQAKSLMPDLILREMTAQQAADLLEFLATLK